MFLVTPIFILRIVYVLAASRHVDAIFEMPRSAIYEHRDYAAG